MRDSEFHGHVTAVAPGKVNLSLRVGPVRPDGYHPVASMYFAVSLYEEVTVAPRADDQITVSVSERSAFAQVRRRDSATGEMYSDPIPVDESNLAHRAAALLRDTLQAREDSVLSMPHRESRLCGVDISLVKNVPIAGGMGGGSADAAATLVACSALWEAGLTKEQLCELGARLGADVPFSLVGGAAVGQGVGDDVSPLLTHGELHLVIVPATSGLSTPEVYRQLDALRAGAGVEAQAVPTLDEDLVRAVSAADPESVATLMINDLQAPAVSMLPELDDMLDAGQVHGALHGMVSGSGPTVLFLTSGAEHAAALASRLQHNADVWAIPVSGPVPGARVL